MEGTSLKDQLRADVRLRRKAIHSSDRQLFDQSINRALLDLVEQSRIASLAAYLPFDGEPDIRPALARLSRQGVQIVLPVVTKNTDTKALQFRCWDPTTELVKSSFGLYEPRATDSVPVQNLDLVLLPLVAWDESGRRLGMGSGFYDRALSSLADRDRPLRVGIAYEAQKSSDLPEDPWDVRLHEVISENGRFTCTG
jgi:5-formyltetrahydrofolate cyclo-ligase